MRAADLRVIVTRKLPQPVETRMAELFSCRFNAEDEKFTREALAEAVAEADILVPTLGDRIDAEILDHASPRLKLIANYGAGFDHIDVAAAHERGIMVSYTPGVLTEDTADMAMALILAVPRRFREGGSLIESGEWQGWSPTALLGHRIGGKELGILGMGRIGQAIARRAVNFGLKINYHNRNRLHPDIESAHSATYWASLDQMLAHVDILSVNAPHTPSTYHLLNARRLKLMKPEAYVVNTARGEVIDENALTRMLRAGELAGAGLDVYEHGASVNPRLRDLKSVLLLPHMGSATLEGRVEMGEKVILNIMTFAGGHRPPDLIVPSML